MGESLSRKNIYVEHFERVPISLCCGAGMALSELHFREREMHLEARERALLELERRWRRGEQWPQTSNTAWISKPKSLDCATDYPKRGGKRRRERGGGQGWCWLCCPYRCWPAIYLQMVGCELHKLVNAIVDTQYGVIWRECACVFTCRYTRVHYVFLEQLSLSRQQK